MYNVFIFFRQLAMFLRQDGYSMTDEGNNTSPSSRKWTSSSQPPWEEQRAQDKGHPIVVEG